MCNCVKEINERVREENRADSAFIEHPGWSEVCVTPWTRKLEPSKHHRYKRVDWDFCPFCGESKDLS